MAARLWFLVVLWGGLIVALQAQTPQHPSSCSAVPLNERLSCYDMWKFDFTEGECTARGCCWEPSLDPERPWCFYAHDRTQVKVVHVVQGCHFDAGFAQTLPDIVNLWFDKYWPLAYKGLGLHCPDEASLVQFAEAIRKGYITYHAFPFNSEPELFDKGTFEFGLQLTHMLDDQFEKPRKSVMSQRDVPGMTRSVIPLLRKHNVSGISVGVNGGSTGPNVPHAFIWRDPASGQEIKAFYVSGGYSGRNALTGEYLTTFVPGSAHAMILDWRGDNAGPPPSTADVITSFTDIQKVYPNALVRSSSFDQFLAAVEDDPAAYWPVISAEIGDTWIHGAASDPLKLAKIRIAQQLRTQCVNENRCSVEDGRFFNFSRLFIKNVEHTWGLDVKTFIPNSKGSNWTNKDLQRLANTSSFVTLSNSWVRQRDVALKLAAEALEDHPLRKEIEAAWSAYSKVTLPSLQGYTRIPPANLTGWTFSAGRFSLRLDPSTGALAYLKDRTTGTVWTDEFFAALEYHTYDGLDYDQFVAEYNYIPFIDLYDFDKVGIGFAGAEHRVVAPSLSEAYMRLSSVGGTQTLSLRLALHFTEAMVQEAGAPRLVWLSYEVSDNIRVGVEAFNKTATRLPEAMFLRFLPRKELLSRSGLRWRMQKLGEAVDPARVVLGGNQFVHGVSQGGVSLSSATAAVTSPNMTLRTLHAPLVSWGPPTPFPVGMNGVNPVWGPPNTVEGGASFLLWDNIWNTNYIMWYPFLPADANSRWQFDLEFA